MFPSFEDVIDEAPVSISLDCNFGSSILKQRFNSYFDSKIIDHSEYVQLFKNQMKQSSANLLFRGTRDSFSSESFHELCDNYCKLIMLVKTKEGDVFGGYTTKTITSDKMMSHVDDESFTFRFENSKLLIFKLDPEKRIESFSTFNEHYLFAFNYMFWIGTHADTDMRSGSFPTTENYILDQCKLSQEIPKEKRIYFGSSNFLLEELEVYQIIENN